MSVRRQFASNQRSADLGHSAPQGANSPTSGNLAHELLLVALPGFDKQDRNVGVLRELQKLGGSQLLIALNQKATRERAHARGEHTTSGSTCAKIGISSSLPSHRDSKMPTSADNKLEALRGGSADGRGKAGGVVHAGVAAKEGHRGAWYIVKQLSRWFKEAERQCAPSESTFSVRSTVRAEAAMARTLADNSTPIGLLPRYWTARRCRQAGRLKVDEVQALHGAQTDERLDSVLLLLAPSPASLCSYRIAPRLLSHGLGPLASTSDLERRARRGGRLPSLLFASQKSLLAPSV